MYGHGVKIIRVVPDPVANPLSQKQDSGPRRRRSRRDGPPDTGRPDVGWGSGEARRPEGLSGREIRIRREQAWCIETLENPRAPG